MKTTMSMITIRDNVFFKQWQDNKTGKLYLQRKRLPENRATPETLQLREKYIMTKFDVIKTIAWLRKTYCWKLKYAVKYFKTQFNITNYSDLHRKD